MSLVFYNFHFSPNHKEITSNLFIFSTSFGLSISIFEFLFFPTEEATSYGFEEREMADDVTMSQFHRNLISCESTSYFPPGNRLLSNTVVSQPPSFGMVPPEYRSPSPKQLLQMTQVGYFNCLFLFYLNKF